MQRQSLWCRVLAVAAVLAVMLGAMPLIAFAAYENTYVNTGNQIADLIGVARTQIGYVEGSNNYNKYAESFGNANQPWCGFFISWCARQANIPTAVIPNSGLASAFKTIGTFHARSSGYTPKAGDLVIFDYGHVSIVERFDTATGKAWVIDGNWSDKVSNHTVSLTDTSVSGFTTPSYTSAVTELSAFNLIKPSVVLKGKGFSIGGLICSTKKLTSVSVTIKDADGNTKINASATPNAKEYDLAGLDSKVAFGTLVAGEYSYIVAAKDASGASKRWANTFEVVSEVTMTISDVVAPTALELGKTFSIRGLITCLENLTTVSVSVYDADNVYKTGGTANPNSLTYDIRGVDKYVSFGSLAAGSYTMRVAARSANAYKTWDYPFVVGGEASFSLHDAVTPDTLFQGNDFTLAGEVRCNLPIAAVSVKILQDGATLQNAVANPHAATYTVGSLNDKLDFSALSIGSYTLRIAARYGSTTEEWLYDFIVTNESFLLNGQVVPSLLKQGVPFDVAGTVVGRQTIDALTLNILDESGNRLSTVTVAPNAKTYDISRISDDVPFSKQAVGSYTFRIGVRAGEVRHEWLFPFTVVAETTGYAIGDLNFDGEVDSIDTMLLYQHVSGAKTLNAAQQAAVGFDSIDITVAMKLYAYTSGNSATYP